MSNITERVCAVVKDQLGGDVNCHTKLIADLDADSLDLIELELLIEDEFEIDIDGELFDGKIWTPSINLRSPDKSVADIVDLVEDVLRRLKEE